MCIRDSARPVRAPACMPVSLPACQHACMPGIRASLSFVHVPKSSSCLPVRIPAPHAHAPHTRTSRNPAPICVYTYLPRTRMPNMHSLGKHMHLPCMCAHSFVCKAAKCSGLRGGCRRDHVLELAASHFKLRQQPLLAASRCKLKVAVTLPGCGLNPSRLEFGL
eukprot:285986-Chlamydomonas_euryale.AAC.1